MSKISPDYEQVYQETLKSLLESTRASHKEDLKGRHRDRQWWDGGAVRGRAYTETLRSRDIGQGCKGGENHHKQD